jgi:hypothetical protein
MPNSNKISTYSFVALFVRKRFHYVGKESREVVPPNLGFIARDFHAHLRLHFTKLAL